MEASKLTIKHQVTIPADVRLALGLKAGDRVAFDVQDGRAVLRKVEPVDWAWAKLVESQLTEWASDADDKAFRDL